MCESSKGQDSIAYVHDTSFTYTPMFWGQSVLKQTFSACWFPYVGFQFCCHQCQTMQGFERWKAKSEDLRKFAHAIQGNILFKDRTFIICVPEGLLYEH